MLDGKFSVYNNGGGEPPPAQHKKPSPINFQFESIQSATLSFDDELRAAMEKFHQEKQPSPVKAALKKWVSENTPKFLQSEPKGSENTHKFLQSEPKVKKEKQPVKEFETPKALKEFGQKVSKWFDFEIKLPSFTLPKVTLPEVKINLPTQQVKQSFERAADAIEKPLISGYEKFKNLMERLDEKGKKVYEDLKELIPTEKIQEMLAFIQDIPQQYIVPAALWMASFIPTQAIKLSFQSGVDKISYVVTKAFDFAQRGYSFVERQVKAVASYIYTTYILPVANLLERFFTWLLKMAKAIYVVLSRIAKAVRGYINPVETAKALKNVLKKSPTVTWNIIKAIWKGLGKATIWVVSRLVE